MLVFCNDNMSGLARCVSLRIRKGEFVPRVEAERCGFRFAAPKKSIKSHEQNSV